MKNKYAQRSRISEKKIREIVRCFAADLTALQTAELTGANRNTVNRVYGGLRERIFLACEAMRPLFGMVEMDESLFGAKRVKGKRGRGAYGKTVVFGVFERDGYVYTGTAPDCSKRALQGVRRYQGRGGRQHRRQLRRTAVAITGWPGPGYGHYRVDHSKDEFARGHVHINGIKGFWGTAKAGPAKVKGTPKHTFHPYIHLKEPGRRHDRRPSRHGCGCPRLKKTRRRYGNRGSGAVPARFR